MFFFVMSHFQESTLIGSAAQDGGCVHRERRCAAKERVRVRCHWRRSRTVSRHQEGEVVMHLGSRNVSRVQTGFWLISAAAAILAADMSVAFAKIETVTVTARKREENVQNIPVGVTTISGEQMQHFNVTTIDKLAQ